MCQHERLLGMVLAGTRLLSERAKAAAPGTPDAHAEDEAGERRLQHWVRLAAGGNPGVLATRLKWLAGTGASVNQLLADSMPAVSPGDWAAIFVAALDAGSAQVPAPTGWPEQGGVQLPFEDLWWPFVEVARGLIAARSRFRYPALAPGCRDALERQLLQRLCRTGESAAYAAFQAWRKGRGGSLQLAEGSQPGTALYRGFVAAHLESGRLFAEYRALARLLSMQVEFWVESCQLFLERLQADFAQILSAFCACRAFTADGLDANADVLGQIGALEAGLSDPHERGRTVIRVEFRNGARLVYKPKDIGIEAAWGGLISWVNDHGPERDLACPVCLPRDGYGWVEFIEHRPCESAGEAGDFFLRSGMLCALFYILRGFDYQADNLVACGAYPVPIDHEMLLYPPEPDRLFHAGQDGTEQPLSSRHSVIKTKLLPVWQSRADGQLGNVGALESACRARPVRHEFRWQHVNTDFMQPGQVELMQQPEQQANIPVLAGKTLLLSDYLPQFVAGFRKMYGFMQQHRRVLLDPDGPLAMLRGCESRYLFRPTGAYISMLNLAVDSANMKDALDFDIFLEQLWRTVALPGRWELAFIVEFEKQAMLQLDVPRLVTTPASHSLAIPGAPVDHRLFARSGYELACDAIGALCQKDMVAQIRLINLMVGCYREGRTPQPAEMEAALSGHGT